MVQTQSRSSRRYCDSGNVSEFSEEPCSRPVRRHHERLWRICVALAEVSCQGRHADKAMLMPFDKPRPVGLAGIGNSSYSFSYARYHTAGGVW